MPVTREDFELVYEFPDGSVKRRLRLYEHGISPEWIFEHLVRREILYKNMTSRPSDPRVPRNVKDALVRKEG